MLFLQTIHTFSALFATIQKKIITFGKHLCKHYGKETFTHHGMRRGRTYHPRQRGRTRRHLYLPSLSGTNHRPQRREGTTSSLRSLQEDGSGMQWRDTPAPPLPAEGCGVAPTPYRAKASLPAALVMSALQPTLRKGHAATSFFLSYRFRHRRTSAGHHPPG